MKPKHGGYASELERRLLEPRDTEPAEAFDDFELSLDLPEHVKQIEVEQVRDGIWRVISIGSRGTRRSGSLYNTEAAAKAAGQHLIGLMMR